MDIDDDNDFDISRKFDIQEQSNKRMIIPRKVKKYDLYQKIMETKMSVVFAIRDQNLAMKCIPKNQLKFNDLEIFIMSEIQHDNLMSCVDYFEFPDGNSRFIAIVMPRAQSDLFLHLFTKGNGQRTKYFPEDLVFRIINSALNALKFLHDNNICHRDIKLENIFVMKETKQGPIIKLGDFGLAYKFESTNFAKLPAMGTIPYAAPELLEVDTTKTDFGCSFTDHPECLFILFQF